MCVQFLSAQSLEAISAEYLAEIPKPFEWKPEVFPRYQAPVLILRKGVFQIVPMHFGLIPPFERNPKPKNVFHNARSETLAQKPSFKRAFQESRCLVPLQAFFESIWEWDPNEQKEKSHRVKFFRKNSQGAFLTAAGLWSLWRNPETQNVSAHFTIITREPPPLILQVGHDRSPVFMLRDVYRTWLDPELKNVEELNQLLEKGREEPEWDYERVKR